MEKLKPLIQHHFWILFGLVLILPVIGWMPAVGQLSQQTASKLGQIEGAFTKIPNGQHANAKWGEQLDNKSKVGEKKNFEARRQLWERQQAMMVWPGTIRKDLQPTTYMEEIKPNARNIYRANYQGEMRKAWLKIDPFQPDTGKGTVIYKLEQVPIIKFGDLTPTSRQIWEAQEDLWLLTSLYESIRRANSDATILTDSLVRSIKTLTLVGGQGEYPAEENTNMDPMGMGMGPEGAMGGMPMSPEDMGGFGDPAMGMGMDGMGGGRMSRPVGPGSVSFNPADEFGMPQGRYVDYKPDTVFKKRGFYLEAIIDHQRLPECLPILSNGSWPVTITRVQMAQVGHAATSGGSNLFSGPGGPGGPFGPGGGRPSFSGPGAFNDMPMPMPGFEDMGMPGDGSVVNDFASLVTAAETGPNLATVAISGVIYFYNPPQAEADPGLEGTETPVDPAATEPAAATDEMTPEQAAPPAAEGEAAAPADDQKAAPAAAEPGAEAAPADDQKAAPAAAAGADTEASGAATEAGGGSN